MVDAAFLRWLAQGAKPPLLVPVVVGLVLLRDIGAGAAHSHKFQIATLRKWENEEENLEIN